MNRFFDWYLLSALACWMLIAFERTWTMRRRGVRLRGNRAELSPMQRMEDLLSGGLRIVRAYEIVASTLPLGFRLSPPALRHVILDALPAQIAGAMLWAVALALYALALHAFGGAWRIGIDPAQNKLVTHGIFSRTRNPIYLAFMLTAVGTFLVKGQLIFLLLALFSIPLLHRRVVREERYLASTGGDPYLEYRSRVRQYFTWH